MKPLQCNTPLYCYSLFMNILQHCIDSRAVTLGRLVHTRLVTTGFGSNVHLDTKLLIFYSKLGRTLDARNVFDRMPDRTVVSWTAMVSGYTQNGCFRRALNVFVEMHRAGFRANQFGFGSALRACTALSCFKSGSQIQGCVQKRRFVENLHVQSALIDFHSKCGTMSDACHMFDEMSDRDLVSWNVIINGFAVQGYSDDSLQVFCSMTREGKTPDRFTFGSLLRGLTDGNHHHLAKVSQLHGLIIQLGFESYSDLSGSLINAYAKCGSLGSSHHVYESMSMKDIVSFTALIIGDAQSNDHHNGKDALDLFREMTRTNTVLDRFALCAMLNICAKIPSLSFGRQIHALTIKHRLCGDVAMGNALISMYAKTGEIREASRTFDEMEERNAITWTSLINGYGKHGLGHEAIDLYKRMEHNGVKPNDVTFLSLLSACSHAGLTDEGWECFDTMVRKYHISPRDEHVSCLVDIFARGGHLEEAYKLLQKTNVTSDASVWSSVLSACSVHGNTALGVVVAKHLFRLNPENPVNYVVLAGLYSSAGAWDKAEKVMDSIRNKSLHKEPGYSLLQSSPN